MDVDDCVADARDADALVRPRVPSGDANNEVALPSGGRGMCVGGASVAGGGGAAPAGGGAAAADELEDEDGSFHSGSYGSGDGDDAMSAGDQDEEDNAMDQDDGGGSSSGGGDDSDDAEDRELIIECGKRQGRWERHEVSLAATQEAAGGDDMGERRRV
jgi:hypothetical protein